MLLHEVTVTYLGSSSSSNVYKTFVLSFNFSNIKKKFQSKRTVSWSLTSLFSTNMAISETNGQFIEDTVEPSVFLPGIISLVIMCIGII